MPDEPKATEPSLPDAQDLPAHEYRQHRMDGKSIEDIVAARPTAEEPETPPEPQKTTDAAPVEAGAERNTDGTFKPKTGKPRHDPKARIEQLQADIATLAKEKGETKAERDAIAAELATLRAERDALKPEPDARKAAAKPEKFPTYDEWGEKHADATYEDYIDARTEFRYDQRRKVEQAEQAQLTQHMEAWKPFQAKETTFKAEHPDYDAVIQRSPVSQMPLPPWVVEEVRVSDHGPALRYHLAQHPDETQWIASLPKAAAVAHLRKLFTPTPADPTVTAAAAPKTQADPPFETVGASATASSRSLETVAAKGSAADYRRLRESGGRP